MTRTRENLQINCVSVINKIVAFSSYIQLPSWSPRLVDVFGGQTITAFDTYISILLMDYVDHQEEEDKVKQAGERGEYNPYNKNTHIQWLFSSYS